MKIFKHPERESWKEILKRPTMDLWSLKDTVFDVFNDVKDRGDEAVREYTNKFDGVDIENSLVKVEEFVEAEKLVKPVLKDAINMARKNIEKFHYTQKEEIKYVQTIYGVECWRSSVAIQKVGLYVPGGSAPLFSTVLMLGVPAKIAGCEEIVLCTPPNKEGKVDPAILYAAKAVGITQIYKIGGIQAIAAMVYGTKSISAVSKIFGPGNQYVTAAKQFATMEGVAIDMPAGPSEVLVLADYSTEPEFIASDLLSQAEHGPDSQVILVTFSEDIVTKVQEAIKTQLKNLPRKDITEKALENSRIIIVKDKIEALAIINAYAPEHLIISVINEGYYTDKIKNAGSVFLGKYTPEAAGDYASGTNHTLPTNGYARAYSGVSLDSFIKKITFQRITREALLNLGPTIEVMAEAEQLEAHKQAVSIRIQQIYNSRINDDDERMR